MLNALFRADQAGPHGSEKGYAAVAWVLAKPDYFARKDRLNKRFYVLAPNLLWRSGFTYVATCRGFVLEALAQVLHQRWPAQEHPVHPCRPRIAISTNNAERSAEAKNAGSADLAGNPFGNMGATIINALCMAKAIHRRAPWRSFEYAALGWVDWINNRRAGAEANLCAALD